jgi:hypothetical protein
MASKFEQALAAAEAAAAAAAQAIEDSDAATRDSIHAEYNEIEVRAALAEASGGGGGAAGGTGAAVALAMRYKKDPLTGRCRVPGCQVQLVSRRLKYLWPFKPFVDQQEKHHCRNSACKLKVCAAHLTRSPKGMKLCVTCAAAGVDGPDLGKEEDEEEEEEPEEREALAGSPTAETPKRSI